jgi:hypothetical protein
MASSLLSVTRLAALVIAPPPQRCFDIILLAPLGAAAQQDHQYSAVPAEVDSVTRSPIYPQFSRAFADRFNIGGVAISKPADRSRDDRGRLTIVGTDFHFPVKGTPQARSFGTIYVTKMQ